LRKLETICFVLRFPKARSESRLLENTIDSRMRIKTITYSDLRQKPCQHQWQGLLQITLEKQFYANQEGLEPDFPANLAC
jgi:hypothetical protein